MDILLEHLYCDAMKRYWNDSVQAHTAVKEFTLAQEKDWDKIYDAAQLLAERQSFTAFLVGLHLGFTLEHNLWEQLGQYF